jgi:Ca-activated chloride channel family protein
MSSMSIEFTRPLLLLVAIPIIAIVVAFFVRSLSDFPRSQRVVSMVVRSLIGVVLVAALAGLTLLHPTQEQFVMFLADQSLSVGENGESRALEIFEEAKLKNQGSKVAFLPFGAAVGSVQQEPPEYGVKPSLAFPPNTNIVSNTATVPNTATDRIADKEPDEATRDANAPSASNPRGLNPDQAKRVRSLREGTSISKAIETAAGFMPAGYVPKIVLLTDGNETSGDAAAASQRCNIPVWTIPLPARSEPEVQVSEVTVPAEVREGEPFFVEVTLHSNHDDEGLIEVFRGDHKVVSETKALQVGENKFRFQQAIDRDRLAEFSVRVSQLKQDTLLDNNSDSGLVYATGKPRVLIIESDPNLIRELAYALEDEGIQVDVRPPQGMPDSLADLQNYELLVLSNVPATALTQQQMDVARTYVQELGGGFMMLGGEQSFGLGGYYKSTLEEILPVRSDFEKEKEKPSLAMVLVIDKSGSMNGEKIEMAKSAARAAVELLGQRDLVAVIAFDGSPYVISEMQSASNKGKISEEIARIDVGGGTTMYPAMEMSNEMLLAASAKLKHVILLTDGVSSPGDFEGLAQQMSSARMTVSTVAIGDGSDTALLESIARIGKGRHYVTNDPSQVPQIFAKETVTASKSAIDEQPFVPQVIRATKALADIEFDTAPFLLGYVMTRPKPTSEVILATEKGDPLLSWWRYGLGVTVAFTSDAKSRWGAEWLTWPGYGKFWTQVVRQAMRKSDASGIQVATSKESGVTAITVDAVSDLGQFLNQHQVELTVIDPSLKRTSVTLEQSAPGRYNAWQSMGISGAYHMEIAVKQNDQVVYRQSRGLINGYSDELRIKPVNEALLRTIADSTGGQFSPTVEQIFAPEARETSRPTPLWPWLVAIAAFLLILDVALRRVDFSLPPFRLFAASP